MNRTRILVGSLIVFGWFVGGCSKSKEAPAAAKGFAAKADITAEEAKAFLDNDESIVYLDVRTVKEFEAGRPTGSWNIPFIMIGEDGNRAKNPDFLAIVEASFQKDAKLVVGCQSGGRSKMAQGALKEAGFTSAVNMLGGFGSGWSKLAYPTESGAATHHGYAELKGKMGT